MIEWYHTLPVAHQVFAGMTIGFGSLLIFSLLLSLVGGEVDLDADIDIDASSSSFSLKGILTFLTFVGFGGWVMLRLGSPLWLAGVVGIGTGYASMSLVLYFMNKLRSLDTAGNRKAEALLHQEGTVYLTIPASAQGVGRIQVKQGARLVEVEALTAGEAIKSGERAKIVEVLGPGKVKVEAIRRVTGGPAFKEFGPV